MERAVEGLVRTGAVDDARLANELAEQLGEARPHAREAVRARLERAKFQGDLVERALDEHAPSTGESERAIEAARAQARRLTALGIDAHAMRRRIYGALGRRGFDAETAAEAINAVLGAWDPEIDAPDADGTR